MSTALLDLRKQTKECENMSVSLNHSSRQNDWSSLIREREREQKRGPTTLKAELSID